MPRFISGVLQPPPWLPGQQGDPQQAVWVGGSADWLSRQLILYPPWAACTPLRRRGNQCRCCPDSLQCAPGFSSSCCWAMEEPLKSSPYFFSIFCLIFHSELNLLMGCIWQNNKQATGCDLNIWFWSPLPSLYCCCWVKMWVNSSREFTIYLCVSNYWFDFQVSCSWVL